MNKGKTERGVVVITLTATAHFGTRIRTHTSRIGFAGDYDKASVAKISRKFKEIYAEQIAALYEHAVKRPDMIVCQTRACPTACDLVLDGR